MSAHPLRSGGRRPIAIGLLTQRCQQGGFIAHVSDCEGNRVELHAMS